MQSRIGSLAILALAAVQGEDAAVPAMTEPPSASLTPEQIAKQSRSSFLVSFVFLPPRRRRALTAIYAFCRVVDDAVDESPSAAEARDQLDYWRRELEAAMKDGSPESELGRALKWSAREFGLRAEPLEEVLAGVTMDLETPRFSTLGELEAYCAKVASAVGQACLPVFGAEGERTERYADRLGKALQLTNILRDLRSDAERGRVYVPREWMEEAGVEPDWLRGTGPDEAYGSGGPVARLADRLAAAAQARFSESDLELKALPRVVRRRLLPARIMGNVYRELLGHLRHRGGDLRCPERLRVGRGRKLFLALTTLVGARW